MTAAAMTAAMIAIPATTAITATAAVLPGPWARPAVPARGDPWVVPGQPAPRVPPAPPGNRGLSVLRDLPAIRALPALPARLGQLPRQYMHNKENAVTMRLSAILKTIKQPL